MTFWKRKKKKGEFKCPEEREPGMALAAATDDIYYSPTCHSDLHPFPCRVPPIARKAAFVLAELEANK
jgi:hypothetical protein